MPRRALPSRHPEDKADPDNHGGPILESCAELHPLPSGIKRTLVSIAMTLQLYPMHFHRWRCVETCRFRKTHGLAMQFRSSFRVSRLVDSGSVGQATTGMKDDAISLGGTTGGFQKYQAGPLRQNPWRAFEGTRHQGCLAFSL